MSGRVSNEHFGESLVKASEVAQLLGVSPKTILRWASEGKLPHYRPGNTTVRFKLSEVSAWVDCCRAPFDPERATKTLGAPVNCATEDVQQLEVVE
jgi:excisionase family DNA binding protein